MSDLTDENAEALTASVAALTGSIDKTLVTRAEYERNRFQNRVAIAIGGVALVILGVLALGNRLLFSELQDQTHALTDQTEILSEQYDYLIECTTPDPNPNDDDPHECFEDGQDRQAGVVEDLLAGFRRETTRQIDRVLTRVLRAFGVEDQLP